MTDPFAKRVYDLWARRLNVPPEVFARHGTTFFFKLPAFVRPDRVLVYRSQTAAVVLLPDRRLERAIAEIAHFPTDQVIQPDQLLERLALLNPRLHWRDYLHYLRPEDRDPPPRTGALALDPVLRLLNPEREADCIDLENLNAALSSTERGEGDVQIDHFAVAACYSEGKLLAAASFITDTEYDVTDVGVIVHPHHRRRGIGTRVVRYLCSIADPERLLQYNATERNIGSLNVAGAAGFTRVLTEEGYAILDDASRPKPPTDFSDRLQVAGKKR